VTETADNLKSASTKIKQGAGAVGALINDQSIDEHVRNATAEFEEDVERRTTS
jgi:hypothetical protein